MSSRRNLASGLLVVAGLVSLASWTLGRTSDEPLEQSFQDPPISAKPRVWWHWMNGNVTQEGITLDLEWMKRVGIGGVQMFDADVGELSGGLRGLGQYVEKRVVFQSPEWKAALRHAAAECDRLGLEMTMHIAGGWSETGGPWVKPEQAMKKIVWSESRVQGPRKFSGHLPAPPSVNSLFQNLPRPQGLTPLPPLDMPEARPQPPQPAPPPDPTYYADSAVIAYRLPDEEVRMADLHPKVTSSAGSLDLARLTDGDLTTPVALPIPESGKPAWIQFEFAPPFRAHAVTIAVRGPTSFFEAAGIGNGKVQASEDGAHFATLLHLPGPAHTNIPVRTYSFPETSAKFYRLEFTSPPRSAFAESMGLPPARQYDIAEVEFHSTPRVNRWEDKASFGSMLEYDSVPTPAVSAALAIARARVIDLTAKMGPDGKLDWDVPPGQWTILRMGYSLTGQKNHPAPLEATGYEVDKLNRKHVESYLRGFVEPVAEALGPLFGKSLRYFLVDSWEAGLQNWTDDMRSEFRRRRGYDPTPYLPVLTGRVVESADVSDRFLWDFRRTLADLLADDHYGVIADFSHSRGVQVYSEAMGINLPTTGDGLLNKGRVDIPMGEFWTVEPPGTYVPGQQADIREAASAAHIYGKPLVAAESFTSYRPGWSETPWSLKWLGDYYMAQGVNRIVLPACVHQPFKDRRPGFTLGPFGPHLSRNTTWAEQARSWLTYLSRSSYMLQQGLFVADLAYYYGEGAPVTVPFWEELKPEPLAGYNYDFLNTEVLLTRLSVQGGRLVLPDGMSYRVLVLPDTLDRLTLPVLDKIRALVAAGATVVGPKPKQSPSLVGYPASDREVWAVANEVWGPCDGRTVTENAYGKGKVYWGKPLGEVLAAQKILPDFEYNRPQMDTHLAWIHRHLGDAEIYFVANQKERTEDVLTRFRVAGKAPELWHPDTGAIEPAEYTLENGRTTVPLHLEPFGSVFVVFREPTTETSRVRPRSTSEILGTVDGPWDVSFPPDWGAPAAIRLHELISWTAHSDEGVKYFSGTATYRKEFTVPPEWCRPGAKLLLDLGRVKEIAEVVVNGKPLGTLWKPPFQVDATEALKPGANRLELKITNLWPNRLIGDQQPSATKKYTFAIYKAYTKDSPLLESGLLGPVRLLRVTPK